MPIRKQLAAECFGEGGLVEAVEQGTRAGLPSSPVAIVAWRAEVHNVCGHSLTSPRSARALVRVVGEPSGPPQEF